MSDTDPRPAPQNTTEVVYRENLRVPVWWWIALVGVVAFAGVQAALIDSQWWLWILLAVLAGLLAWLFWNLSQETLVVTSDGQGNGSITAGGATLPFDAIHRCAAVPATAKQAAMGPQLDPAAWVVHKGYIPQMVIIVLDDPDDPTPYWLISSRSPDELVDALPDNSYS